VGQESRVVTFVEDSPDFSTSGSTGLALLVDDDELVRAITADMLDEMGYRVVEAASAVTALKILE
jgi:response regulator RpfG family c-di-GMP phosphodiesterase